MLKKDLRLKILSLRNSTTSEYLSEQSLQLANTLLTLPIWNFSYYHLFLPITKKKEIDTSYILSILQGKDKNVVLPKMTGDQNLKHFLLTDSTVIKLNKWGVPEPLEGIEVPIHKIDVVFVPLLAFDTKGNRVGYGKGFYDIFLKECNPNVVKIGLSLFDAEESIDDIAPDDVPLDYCITPDKVYSF
ncbi:5-formyltetrahydrofolate cyclo-ligase [Sediminicola sp. YIK13]|uniref:5-formyltetrahydrofolate cyclo-ligase n=1 Tax=Sediminicola sp. YIK13 TaxID=1453352 RepID=UPI0007206BB6|nr:5-formyltetrahydrofolate cyclo-ligase [Sediminicola sp. YIK13]ALM08648.1 5-formyltetrahydrofolate cyclo-ligase [Sediminicola sp. YIK13]